MSIASEFDSTIENIKSDYEGLENLGADLTNVNKNIQNIRTCLDNIYTNLPKTTGEGSNLSLSTLKGRINVEAVKGDTSQDSTTGKNIWHFISDNWYRNNNTSYNIINENTLQVTTSSSIAYSNTAFKLNLVDGTYTISLGKATNSNSSMTTKRITLSKIVSGTRSVMKHIDEGTPQTITITNENDTQYVLEFWASYSTALSNTAIFSEIQVESGSTATSYEPYTGGIASPNPTYPQDINVVTGTQEVLVQNRNLISGVELGKYSNETGAKVDDNSVYRNTEFISIMPSTTYTFSINGTTQGINKFYYDENKNFIEKTSDTNAIFTTPNNAYYLNIFRGTSTGNTGWQLEKGSTATPYTPHQEQTKTLHLSSKNLFQTEFRQGGFGGTEANRIFSTSNAKIKSGVTYTLSTNLDTTKFRYACNIGTAPFPTTIENRVYDSGWKYSSSFTFTASTSGYFGLPVSKNDNSNLTPSDIEGVWWQLEEGSTTTTYEPYYNYELSKIGTYQDRIFESSGKNYINEATEITQGGTVAPADTTRVSIRVAKQLKANTTYTFITNLPVPSFAYAFVLGTKASPWSSSQQIYDSGWQTSAQHFTYTTTQDCYVNIPIRNSTGTAITPSDISKYWFMIYEGAYDSNILYEPYGSDKWYIEKNIGKYILENAKNWQYISVTQGSLFRSNNSISNAIIDNSYAPYCNYYKGIPLSQTRANNNIIINNSSTYTYIDIVDNRYTSVDTFKTWLASNNVELLYVLATPTYTEITNESLINELNEIEKMMSYNGQTNISVSGNLPMILDISALKGE